MAGGPTVRRALAGDLSALVPLFDAYRQFYGQASDEAGAALFLGERVAQADSILLLAEQNGDAAGFGQLYYSFSSTRMARIFILNDLFVSPGCRGRGVGTALLDGAADQARKHGAVRMTLSTQIENRVAQSVYEAAGWVRDDAFYVYNLQLNG